MRKFSILFLFILIIMNIGWVSAEVNTKTYYLKYYLDYPTVVHIKVYDNILNKIVYNADVQIDQTLGFASIQFNGASSQGTFSIDVTFELFGEEYNEHYEITTSEPMIIITSSSFINVLNIENIDSSEWSTKDNIIYVYVMNQDSDFPTFLNNMGILNFVSPKVGTSSNNVVYYFMWDTTTINTTIYNADYTTDETFVWNRISYYPGSLQDISKSLGVGFAKFKDSTLYIYIPQKFTAFSYIQLQLVQRNKEWESAVIEIQNYTESNIPYTIQYSDFKTKIGINNKVYYLNMMKFPQDGMLWIFNSNDEEIYADKTYSDYITLSVNGRIVTLNAKKSYSYTFITFQTQNVNFSAIDRLLFYLSEYSILIVILLIVLILLFTKDASQTLLFSFIIITLFSFINHNYLLASLMLIFSVALVIASDKYEISIGRGGNL